MARLFLIVAFFTFIAVVYPVHFLPILFFSGMAMVAVVLALTALV